MGTKLQSYNAMELNAYIDQYVTILFKPYLRRIEVRGKTYSDINKEGIKIGSVINYIPNLYIVFKIKQLY